MWPKHCIQETDGAQFAKNLYVNESDYLISKGLNTVVDSASAFGTYPEITDLEKMLNTKSISRVFIVGLPLEHCVRNTALDAIKKGY